MLISFMLIKKGVAVRTQKNNLKNFWIDSYGPVR